MFNMHTLFNLEIVLFYTTKQSFRNLLRVIECYVFMIEFIESLYVYYDDM